MKVIVAGSRHIKSAAVVYRAIRMSEFNITQIVSGGCRGVDRFAEYFAKEYGIDLRVFPADWKQYGNKAGPIRNSEMAQYADALIAIQSLNHMNKGSDDMIRKAITHGLRIARFWVNGDSIKAFSR